MLERLQPEVPHPLRLRLELRDLLDDLPIQALRRLVQVVLGVAKTVALLIVGVDRRPLLVLRELNGHYSTSSLIVSSSMITGYVSTGTYAGKVNGLPVFRSNSDPCRGHSTVQLSGSNSPSASGPSSCEQRSSIAYRLPPQLNTPISTSSHSISRIWPGGSSSTGQTSMISGTRA